MGTTTNNNIVLITVDCWRYDDVAQMEEVGELASQWDSGSCITAAPHSPGAFPALFTSTYFPDLYSGNRDIPDDTPSLPRLLSGAGYSTGGFVASNAMLDTWSDHFDEYWNDGLRADGINQSERISSNTTASNAIDHLKLRSEVTADNVFDRADDWWNSESGPKFLWAHLMEPHVPYLPGLRRGLRIGPFRTYLSLFLRSKHDDNINYHGTFPDWARQHLKKLHVECAKSVDSKIADFVKGVSDTSDVIITGDHGEEFDHGLMTHARLYDETVRVPFITNTDVLPESGYIRQQDIAPTLLAEHGIEWPENWEGRSTGATMPPQEMIGSLNRDDKPFWLGVRSEDWKLIRRHSLQDGFSETEVYDLTADPEETNDLDQTEAPAELRNRLERFVETSDVKNIMDGFVGDPDPATEDRLRQLGYIE